MIRISIPLLDKQQVIELNGSEPAEILDLGSAVYRVENPVNYQLKAQRVTGGALVTGSVSTLIEGECGRCLVPMSTTVANEDVHLFYEINGQNELDITEDVRAELVVELPMNLLCDPECAGLCPVCGANLNDTECDCVPPELPPEKSDGTWSALNDLSL